MAWDDVKNVLGQVLGDLSLFLRPVSRWGTIPDVMTQRQLDVQQPQVRQSLIGSPFRAGVLGVSGKDVGGQFQPNIPETQEGVLRPVVSTEGKPISGLFIDPTSGKYYHGGQTLPEIVQQAKDMGLDTSGFRLSGMRAGGLEFQAQPGPVPPPPLGMVERTAKYNEKTGQWVPTAKTPGEGGEKAMSPDQLRALGIDPASTMPAAGGAPPPAGPVQKEVETGAAQIGVDPGFASSIAKNESAFRPGAVSPKGARGVMQVMPQTSTTIQQQQATGQMPKPIGVSENIAEGEGLLSQLQQRYQQIPSPAREGFIAAAYNAGPNRVDAARQQVEQGGGDPNNLAMVMPLLPPETEQYVGRVMRDWQGARGPVSRLGPQQPPAGVPMSEWLGAHPGSRITMGPGGVRSVTLGGPPQVHTEMQRFFAENPTATMQDWQTYQAAKAGNVASARGEANQLVKEKYKTFPAQAQQTLSSIYALRGLATEMKAALQDPTVASNRGALEGRIRSALFNWGIAQAEGENVYQTLEREMRAIGIRPYLAGGRGAIRWINQLQTFMPAPGDQLPVLDAKLGQIVTQSNELEKDVRSAAKERVNPELGAPGPEAPTGPSGGAGSSEQWHKMLDQLGVPP